MTTSHSIFIAGIDEAGRGPLAGPLVSAAVILKKRQRIPGLKDSKQLTHMQREHLYGIITKNCIAWGTGVIPNTYIDKNGLTKSVQEANNLALKKLKTQPDMVLIDGNDKQTMEYPHKTIIKGDTFVREIMAASVIAKVERDRMMVKLAKKYPQYKFEKHKGYGTRLHQDLLKKHKPCPIHRKSYTPVAELIN